MPITFIPIGKMSADFGPGPGDHSWYLVNLIPSGDGGYTTIGEPDQVTFATDIPCITAAPVLNAVRGVHGYSGAYTADKMYIALKDKIFMDGTDVSGMAYTNGTTYGMQFCTYGPYVFATNRASTDPIQVQDVTIGGAFANITVGARCANPRAATICTYKNHVVLGNITVNEAGPATGYGALLNGTYPSLIWWSGTDLPMYFGSPAEGDSPAVLGTDYRQTFDGDGEIVKLVATDSCVIIFKSQSILRMDGPPFQISLLSNQYGTRHPYSVKVMGRRVYFVSDFGPAYVDIDNNSVVSIGPHRISRALGVSDGHLGYTMPPGPRGAGTSFWGISSYWGSGGDPLGTTAAVDSFGRNVVFMFKNNVLSYGSTSETLDLQDSGGVVVLVYNETNDEFSLWKVGSANCPAARANSIGWVTERVPRQSEKRLPLGDIMFLQYYDNSGAGNPDKLRGLNLNSNSLVYEALGGYGTTATFCLPFKLFSEIESGATSSIEAIKPIWYSEWETDKNPTFKARIYTTTLSGWGDWFGLNRCVVSDSHSSSDDGWLTVDTPSGKSHAVTLDIAADPLDEQGWTTIRGIYGILVKYATNGAR